MLSYSGLVSQWVVHPTHLTFPSLRLCSNLANAASLLWHAYKSLPSPSNNVNWAGRCMNSSKASEPRHLRFVIGFYTLDPKDTSGLQLVLGPFQGKVACQAIAFGKGVCGTAAAEQTTQLVPDVEQFPGHIACDGDSRSEIVVPIVVGDAEARRLVAIIDIDCAELNGFDEVDKRYLEKLAGLLARGCDW